MGDSFGETCHSGSMRPSHRPEAVREVLDIIQQQNHFTKHAVSNGDVSKSRKALPAIKGSGATTPRQLHESLEDSTWGSTAGDQNNHNEGHRKHTQRLNLGDQDHIFDREIMKTSPLQREGTRSQLPPLSLRCESRGNNVHDRTTNDSKRGIIQGADTHTQVRPSTGYGRRRRAASFDDEFGDAGECQTAHTNGKSSSSHNASKEKSGQSEQRPRSSYGSRMQPSREQTQDTLNNSSSIKDNNNSKYGGVKTKYTSNKHRPLRMSRSHELEHDYPISRDPDTTHAVSNTTFVRPKSSKGRYRKPPSPRLDILESDFTKGIDLARPGAPTPPSDILEDENDIMDVKRNHTSRLMTL